jgi:hypothetical protein
MGHGNIVRDMREAAMEPAAIVCMSASFLVKLAARGPRPADRECPEDEATFIRMNDLIVQTVVVIPLIWRNAVAGAPNRLKSTDISDWDFSGTSPTGTARPPREMPQAGHNS